MLAKCSGRRVGTDDTSLSPVQPLEIEISKKNIFDRKTKMFAKYSGHRIGNVDSSRNRDIEENFFEQKNLNILIRLRETRL